MLQQDREAGKRSQGCEIAKKEMIFPAGIQGEGRVTLPSASHQGRASCAHSGMLRLSQGERFPAFQILLERLSAASPRHRGDY